MPLLEGGSIITLVSLGVQFLIVILNIVLGLVGGLGGLGLGGLGLF